MQRTICSIFYKPLETQGYPFRERDGMGGFFTKFRMPAAPRDGYVTLTINDMDEYYKFSSEAPVTPMPFPGEDIAASIVREWRDTMLEGNSLIGVFICTDLDEKHPLSGKVIKPATEPSERELAQWKASQEKYAEMMCQEAGDLYARGQLKQIGARHRDAAEWLGKNYPWMRPAEQAISKPCPFCMTQVPSAAVVCANCRNVIDPAGFAALQARPMVAEPVLANP